MKKFAVLCLLMLSTSLCFAEQKVPDYQISITTSGLWNITLTTSNRLSDLVLFLDSHMVFQTNLVGYATTNGTVQTIANMMYPYFTTNYQVIPTNFVPRFIGDELICTNGTALTGFVYRAVGLTTNNWKVIYQGAN